MRRKNIFFSLVTTVVFISLFYVALVNDVNFNAANQPRKAPQPQADSYRNFFAGIKGSHRDLMTKEQPRTGEPLTEEEQEEVERVLGTMEVKKTFQKQQQMRQVRLGLLGAGAVVPFHHPIKKKPVFSALFGFNSLRLKGKDNPLVFAKDMIIQRLQEEIINGTYLARQKEVKKLVVPKLLENPPKHPLIDDVKIGDVVPPSKARMVIIASTWRSGSSFTGKLFNQYPGTFYSYEPFHYHRAQNGSEDCFMKDLFTCNFNKDNVGYLKHLSQNVFLGMHNERLARVCKHIFPSKAACFIPKLVKDTCDMMPVRLIKTVRIRIADMEPLLQEFPNLKILVLFRDPRGFMNSRSSMEWCTIAKCKDVKTVCRHMSLDLAAAMSLREAYPGQVDIVRYEDLSNEPQRVLSSALDFLELPPSKAMQAFVEHNTKNPSNTNPYGMTRVSKETSVAWRSKIDFTYADKIQKACHEPMSLLGYNQMESESSLRNTTIPIFDVSTVTVI